MTTLFAALALAAPLSAAPDFPALRRMARAQDLEDSATVRGALEAEDPALRGEAAWALGQLGLAEFPDGAPEPATQKEAREVAAVALVPVTSDPDALVRASAVEALGKTAGPAFEATLAAAGTDADPRVRAEAALALFRQRQLKRVPEYSTAAVNALLALAEDGDAEVRWRAVYAFTRWPEPRAQAALERASRAADARERLFAVRALAKLGVVADPGLVSDPDPYVRAEAVGSYGAGRAADRLPAAAFIDESPHVRAAAADAAATSTATATLAALETMADADTPLPRGRALLALATRQGQADRLAIARVDPHWWTRSRAYEATALLPDSGPLLEKGLSDPDPRVASAALEGILKSTGAFADATLDRVLRDAGAPLELLGTAVDAAAERSPVPADALLHALKLSAPGLTAEVRGTIRKALKAAAAADKSKAAVIAEALSRFPEKTDKPRTYKRLNAPATVVLQTEKGLVEIALDDIEAPQHAASLVDSVKRGIYEGTVWHRVVTAFVVQGGDPRGSGWGDDGWRLADEIGRRRFVRGTLGMPKAGKDTGGCQLFVSLVPTPHLDGRYTAFGQVTAGLDVIDRLEPGDKILSARLK